MDNITMSRLDLECHLAVIDDRIEKSILVMGFLERYIDGDSADLLNNSIEISVEMARDAQHEIDKIKSKAGIKAEAQVTP
ncbi:MAG: hypothetical protein ACTS6J_03445 [Burkholderiales bacterium]